MGDPGAAGARGESRRHTGQTADRNFFMSAKEAVTYGIIDEILEPTHVSTPTPALTR